MSRDSSPTFKRSLQFQLGDQLIYSKHYSILIPLLFKITLK